MAQSLSKLYIHLIFHIKGISVAIRNEDKKELFAYMGAIIKDNDSFPILINGTKDHIHILCVMSKNIALAKLIEEIKRHSSRWIKTRGIHYQDFAWQGGYSGYSVSPSKVKVVDQYIENQKSHHKHQTFQEEYIQFLKEHGVV